MNLRDQIAAALFWPVAGGDVYREPYRWPFGDAPHYLVNENQKAALMALVIPRRPILSQLVMWSTLILMVAIACGGVWLYTGHDNPSGVDGFAIALVSAAEIMVGLAVFFCWKRHQVRPLLATLPRTQLRITPGQMRASAASAMSRTQVAAAAVAGIIASVAMCVNGALRLSWHQPLGLLWFVGSVFFAGLAWYYFKLLIRRAHEPAQD
jgi:NADH:ubiquinone oxidoreductase subunit K